MSRLRVDQLLVTCEHASDAVPRDLRGWLGQDAARKGTHFSYDLGAKSVAQMLARAFSTTCILGSVSRLVVDLNRSPGHPRVIGPSFRVGGAPDKRVLLERFHKPHWHEVRKAAEKVVRQRGRVLHLAIHSFTPELGGELRTAELGLLYDPSRALERSLCERWQGVLASHHKTRRNYPYRGVDDGLVTNLRGRFAASRYLGIEVEINQRLLASGAATRMVAKHLADTLAASVERA